MTILPTTGRYIFFLSVFILILEMPVVTGQNKKGGVTVSYESSGSSRIARFTNSNSPRMVPVVFPLRRSESLGSCDPIELRPVQQRCRGEQQANTEQNQQPRRTRPNEN